MSYRAAFIVLLASLLFSAGQAVAARVLVAELLARAPAVAAAPAMSALALQACLAQAEELDRTGVAVDEKVMAIDRMAAEGMFLQNRINTELPVLGDFDEKALNDFQRRVIRHEEISRQFKSDFPAYQKDQKDYNAALAAFDSQCAGGFTTGDLAAVKAKFGIK